MHRRRPSGCTAMLWLRSKHIARHVISLSEKLHPGPAMRARKMASDRTMSASPLEKGLRRELRLCCQTRHTMNP